MIGIVLVCLLVLLLMWRRRRRARRRLRDTTGDVLSQVIGQSVYRGPSWKVGDRWL